MISPKGKGDGFEVRITLTEEQKEAARIAGVSYETYAQQLIRLIDEKMTENLYTKDHRSPN